MTSKKIMLAVLLIIPYCLSAQQDRYFIANGKKIEIRSFNREMEKLLDEAGIPALSLAVINDNKTVYAHTWGVKRYANKEPVDQNSVFEAASLSKIFLVYVIYKLADNGLIDLNRPMYKYLPYEPLQHDERYKQITPAMILSHSSGIENWRWNNNEDTLEIVADPGKRFVYSGEGFQYLARVAETILHRSYEQIMHDSVIAPLQMHATYLKYDSLAPANYATGHDELGRELEKWKNREPVPASGIHTTAGDYARLITALFRETNISRSSMGVMLTPVVPIGPDNSQVYMGPGFSLIFAQGDTIVAFSGSNSGFKAEIMYSVVSKKGFVLLTNSDRGNLILEKLNEMTAGLDINFLFAGSFYEQYPSTAFRLLRICREQDAAAMFAEIERLKEQEAIGVNTLNELGDLFIRHDKAIAKKLLEQNTALYPTSALAWCLLGGVCFEMEDYAGAYKHLQKAKALHFTLWDIEYFIRECEKKLSAAGSSH